VAVYRLPFVFVNRKSYLALNQHVKTNAGNLLTICNSTRIIIALDQ